MAEQIMVGDRVWWTTYGEVHEGVVAERFNSTSFLIDRERQYSFFGTSRDDIDLVNARRLHKIENR